MEHLNAKYATTFDNGQENDQVMKLFKKVAIKYRESIKQYLHA